MTQEDRELLLKDLCARLPYKVKVKVTATHSNGNEYDEYGHITDIDNISNSISYCNDSNGMLYEAHPGKYKPYLRPMSSMTEEERNELSHYDNSVQRTDFFYSHHIDCRYMIEKGLALEAPEGMYNIKK